MSAFFYTRHLFCVYLCVQIALVCIGVYIYIT